MSDLNPEALGLDEFDQQRMRVIAEVAGNRAIAKEAGRLDHIAALDRMEAAALEAIELRRNQRNNMEEQ